MAPGTGVGSTGSVRTRRASGRTAHPVSIAPEDFGFRPGGRSDRGRLDSHHAEIRVELGAMMDVVLLHAGENPVERVLPLPAVRRHVPELATDLRGRSLQPALGVLVIPRQ